MAVFQSRSEGYDQEPTDSHEQVRIGGSLPSIDWGPPNFLPHQAKMISPFFDRRHMKAHEVPYPGAHIMMISTAAEPSCPQA